MQVTGSLCCRQRERAEGSLLCGLHHRHAHALAAPPGNHAVEEKKQPLYVEVPTYIVLLFLCSKLFLSLYYDSLYGILYI